GAAEIEVAHQRGDGNREVASQLELHLADQGPAAVFSAAQVDVVTAAAQPGNGVFRTVPQRVTVVVQVEYQLVVGDVIRARVEAVRAVGDFVIDPRRVTRRQIPIRIEVVVVGPGHRTGIRHTAQAGA